MLDSTFWEVHSGLPREGPGDEDCLRRALEMIGPLREDALILDAGCGPGAATLQLAAHTQAQILAVDLHRPFLERLNADIRAHELGARVRTARCSMMEPPLPDNSADLIWCEGAAYIPGFERALRAWKRYLKPKGFIAVSEPCWLTPAQERSKGAVDNWAAYPPMAEPDVIRARATGEGYREIGSFVLPPEAWWTYYRPMEARVASLREKHRDAPATLEALKVHQAEIDAYREHGAHFSYLFLVLQLDGGADG